MKPRAKKVANLKRILSILGRLMKFGLTKVIKIE